MDDADAVDHVVGRVAAVGRDVPRLDADVVQAGEAFASHLIRVEVHAGDLRGKWGDQADVVPGPAARIQHPLSPKVLEAPGLDPGREERGLVVLEMGPLVGPFGLHALLVAH